MINIDTRLLPQVTPDQLFLLCHIVNFMNENKMCFPSNKKLIEQCKFSESKILRIKNELVTRKIISVKQRFRPDGSQTSNLYKIESEFIGVFITGKNMSDLDTTPFTDEEGEVFTHKEGTPSAMNTQEVLANRSINNIKVLKECENSFTPPQPKIKNSFARQSIHDSISHEQGFKEKEKSTREKEKESQEPTETYSAFIAYCQAYENCAKVTLPKNKQGNYIMSAKDGSNCKKLISWIKQIAVVEGTMDEMVAAFTKAAWHVSDKFMKNNFSISMIYSNANAIYTKFHYQNPAAQEKRRQEEIERLVNEYQP
jgi:hypothetical protein